MMARDCGVFGMNSEVNRLCKQAASNGRELLRFDSEYPFLPLLTEAIQTAARFSSSQRGQNLLQHQAEEMTRVFLGEIGLADFLRDKGVDVVAVGDTKPLLALVMSMARSGDVYTMDSNAFRLLTVLGGQSQSAGFRTLPITASNQFLFPVEACQGAVEMVMAAYPHDLSGQVADVQFWESLCSYCQDKDIRLFNDGSLWVTASPRATSLAEVAVRYPDLSWAELFSSSIMVGGDGTWQAAAVCGSPDFVDDIRSQMRQAGMRGNLPFMAGVVKALKMERKEVRMNLHNLRTRLKSLVDVFEQGGMASALVPQAGFSSLWHVPQRAFSQPIENAVQFNEMMIEKTGIVGIPSGEFVRYVATSPVEVNRPLIKRGLAEAEIAYGS